MWEEEDKLTTNLVYSASDRKAFHFSKFGVLRKYFQNLHIGEESLKRKLDELSTHVPKSRNAKKRQTVFKNVDKLYEVRNMIYYAFGNRVFRSEAGELKE